MTQTSAERIAVVRAWQAAHPEAVRQHQRTYYQRHKAARDAASVVRMRAWRAAKRLGSASGVSGAALAPLLNDGGDLS